MSRASAAPAIRHPRSLRVTLFVEVWMLLTLAVVLMTLTAYALSRFGVPLETATISLLLAGLSLVGVLALVMLSLSRRLSQPLELLAKKLDGLEAKGWKFPRSIFTGNEIEVVDRAAFALTHRLRDSHVYLESVVKDRTKELTQQHAQDEAMFQSIEYGLLVTDRRGAIILMNAAAEQLTGWTMQKVQGRSFDTVLRIVDKDLHAVVHVDHPVTHVLKTRQKFQPLPDPKFSLFHRAGRIMPLSLRVTPILRGSRCTGAVAVFRDTTEDRRIDRMKSDFISLVSHQLRTPLSTIRWYVEMLLSPDAGALTDEQRSSMRQVESANERMVRLVDALLNVSRIELGKFALSAQSIDARAMLKRIQQTFAKEIADKGVVIRYRDHGASAWRVTADSILLQLILENILSNAIKYSRPKGVITITHRMHRDAANGRVTLSITDQGIGIPEGQQKRVFEKLFRADNARQSDTDGNGLGLYISHVAADTIGASLTFDSTEGAGTTVSLGIPVRSRKAEKAGRKEGRRAEKLKV